MEIAKRLKFAAGQLGPKPGKVQVLARLLDPAELPGPAWRTLEERTWRAGVGGSAPWQARARSARSVVAWRSYTPEPTGLALWIEYLSLGTPDDAHAALADVPDLFLKNVRGHVEVRSEREVDGPKVEGADTRWCLEQVTRTRGFEDSTCKFLACTPGSHLLVMMCGGVGSGWTWEDVAALASRQVDKLTTPGTR